MKNKKTKWKNYRKEVGGRITRIVTATSFIFTKYQNKGM